MATSAISTSSSFTSEKINYIRLFMLVTDIGTNVLRYAFDLLIPPGDLQKHLNSTFVRTKLKKLRKKKVLYTQQWNKLYPTSGVPSSNTFDTTLLSLLLRETVSGLKAPSTGWGAAPLPTDSTTEADMIRVKLWRNKIAHETEQEFSDADFEKHWNDIEDVLNRLGKSKFKADIKSLRNKPLDPEIMAKMKTLDKRVNNIEEALTDLQEARPKPFCILPQKPSHDTVHRHDDVLMTLEKMSNLRTTYPSRITVTYLSGNPGCGKSELARQIGEKFFEDIDKELTSTFVATLNASTKETLIQSYMKLAYKIGCNELSVTTTIEKEKISLDQKLSSLQASILAKIENYSLWLMIVDNVEDIQMVSTFVPHSGQKVAQGNGHVLVTTQDTTSIPTSDSHTNHIKMHLGMKLHEAAHSLHILFGFPCSEKIALQVCRKLDYQPLALACAAHYMRQTRSLTDSTMNWEGYLAEFKKANMFDQHSMKTAVKMAVKRAIEKSQVLHHAFAFMAAIAPEFISLEHVINYVLQCIPNQREHSVAQDITSSSLIIISSKDVSKKPSVRIHQVVYDAFQSVYQAMFQQEDSELSFLMKFTKVFSSYLREKRHNDLELVRATASLAQHFACFTEKVKQHFEQHKILKTLKEGNQYGIHYEANKFSIHNYIPLIMFLLHVVSEICIEHYKYRAARTVLEISYSVIKNENRENSKSFDFLPDESTIINKRHYGRTHQDLLALILNNLGIVFMGLDLFQEAKRCYQRALAIDESIYGSNHPNLAPTLSNYALLLDDLNLLQEAKECYQRALAIDENTYGINHSNLAKTLNNYALLLEKLDLLQEAKECYQRALAIQETTYGSNHPNLATTLNNYGLLLENLDLLQEAKECYQRALAIQKSTYGNNHPDLAITLSNYARLLDDLDLLQEAKECYQSALVIKETTYGSDHPNLATTLSNYGLLLKKLDLLQEAKECYQRSLAIQETTYGSDHLNLATTLNNYALLLEKLDLLQEAKECYQRALAIEETTYGSDHPNLVTTLDNYGQLLEQLNLLQEAKECYQRALAIQETTCGSDDTNLATTLNNYALLLMKLELPQEAKECYQRALAIQETTCGSDHPNLSTMLCNYGLLLKKLDLSCKGVRD